jgi:hypothetical protein
MKMISNALLKEQLKRYWVLIPLSLLAYLLFVFLPIYLHPGGRDDYLSAHAMLDVLSMQNPFLLFATVVIPFGTVMMLFSYLFDSRATAGFYGFSETKGQLFWTNVVTGLIVIIVPLLITSLFMLITVRMPEVVLAYPPDLFGRGLSADSIINTFPTILGFFARMAVSYLFFFAIFLLAVTVSGSAKIAVLLSIIIPIAPAVFYRLGKMILSLYVFGYDALDAPLPDEILTLANPLAWFNESLINGLAYIFTGISANTPNPVSIVAFTNPLTWHWNFGVENQALYFLSYIGITIVALVIAAACFSSRKMEQASEGIVFRPFKHVMIFVLAIVGMFAMGAFMLNLLTGRAFIYYGFVIGFILAFLVGHMVFGNSFKVSHTVKWIVPVAGIAAALYGILFLITGPAANFHTNYVPRPAAVAGVHIGTERRVAGEAFDDNPETIARVIHLHEQIIQYRRYLTSSQISDMSRSDRRSLRDDRRDHRRDMRTAHWQSISGGGQQFTEQGGLHVYIAYRMNNGDIEYRRYALPGSFIRQTGAMELLDPAAFALPPAPIFENPGMVESMEFEFAEGGFGFTIDDPAHIEIFLMMIGLDLAIANEMQNDEPYHLTIYVQVSPQYLLTYRHPVIRLSHIEHTLTLLMEDAE